MWDNSRKGWCEETWAGESWFLFKQIILKLFITRYIRWDYNLWFSDSLFTTLSFSIQLAYSPEVISHHLFGGLQVQLQRIDLMEPNSNFTFLQDFRGGFKVLLAGGGTGDPLLQLCEELRGSGAEVFLPLTLKVIIVSTTKRCSWQTSIQRFPIQTYPISAPLVQGGFFTGSTQKKF